MHRFVLILLIAVSVFTFYLYTNLSKPQTLGDTVEIVAQVSTCLINLTFYPEERIPNTNNWSVGADVSLYNNLNQQLFNTTVTTNNLGQTTINNCNLGSFPVMGNYTYSIKGESHLTRIFPNIYSFYAFQSDINLTNKLLLAGDTSIIADDYVNSLDISTQITNFLSNTIKDDLNRDGIVNTLDINLTVKNIFLSGETL